MQHNKPKYKTKYYIDKNTCINTDQQLVVGARLTDDGVERLELVVVVVMLRTESDSSGPDAVDTT